MKLPELENKTEKMFRGGIICTEEHFLPLWSAKAPKMGIIHSLINGLAPWLAIEIPNLINKNLI